MNPGVVHFSSHIYWFSLTCASVIGNEGQDPLECRQVGVGFRWGRGVIRYHPVDLPGFWELLLLLCLSRCLPLLVYTNTLAMRFPYPSWLVLALAMLPTFFNCAFWKHLTSNFFYYLLSLLHPKCFSVFLSSARWKPHFNMTLPSQSLSSCGALHQTLELLPGLQGIKRYCSVWTAVGHQKTGVCAQYPLSGEQKPPHGVQSGTDVNIGKVSHRIPKQGSLLVHEAKSHTL